MNILVERICYHPEGVLGKFLLGAHELYTVERPWINNEPYVSCIPEGEYLALPYSSEKYPDTFELQNVPGRTKILFCHIGNYPKNVQGCFALGTDVWDDRIAVKNSGSAIKIFKELTKDEETLNVSVVNYSPEYP
jgi:hypothetical protein